MMRRLHAELKCRGVSERTLAAMAAVPRDAFVPAGERVRAYANEPLPIGEGQTISQPWVVGLMCDLLDVRPGDRVLDVGTGSGWHAALLAQLGGTVTSIERHAALADAARSRLAGVEVVVGDGTAGVPARAPFDAINVAAGAGAVPPALTAQLADGGRLVIPLGDELVLIRRDGPRLRSSRHGGVRFVPLVGGLPEP